MKLALHRSITFWAGILVMGFICWAWRDSTRRQAYLAHAKWGAWNVECGIQVTYDPHQSPGSLRVGVNHFGRAVRTELFPAPAIFRGGGMLLPAELAYRSDFESGEGLSQREWLELWEPYARKDTRTWFIPHWLILLAFAPLWTTMLLRRARRRKRIFTP